MTSPNDQLTLIKDQLREVYGERLRRLDTERKKLEDEYQKAMSALDELRRLTERNGSRVGLSAKGQVSDRIAKNLTEAVRLVISEMHARTPFTINTIIEAICKKHPEIRQPINPTSVSGILRKLEADNYLELVSPGRGKIPAVYKIAEGATLTPQRFMLKLD
jgi:hypothetical protein